MLKNVVIMFLFFLTKSAGHVILYIFLYKNQSNNNTMFTEPKHILWSIW